MGEGKVKEMLLLLKLTLLTLLKGKKRKPVKKCNSFACLQICFMPSADELLRKYFRNPQQNLGLCLCLKF